MLCNLRHFSFSFIPSFSPGANLQEKVLLFPEVLTHLFHPDMPPFTPASQPTTPAPGSCLLPFHCSPKVLVTTLLLKPMDALGPYKISLAVCDAVTSPSTEKFFSLVQYRCLLILFLLWLDSVFLIVLSLSRSDLFTPSIRQYLYAHLFIYLVIYLTDICGSPTRSMYSSRP